MNTGERDPDGPGAESRPPGLRSTGWRPSERSGPPSPAIEPSHRSRSGAAGGVLIGEVSGLTSRSEHDPDRGDGTSTHLVWTFTLERFDDSGNRLPPVPVQLRGRSFDGALRDGDWVQVQAIWRPGTTVHVKEVLDLTTGALVRAHRPSKIAQVVGIIVIALIVGGFVAFWIVFFTSSGPSDDFPGGSSTIHPNEVQESELPLLAGDDEKAV